MDHTGAMIGPILAIVTLLILFTGFGITDTTLALRWTFILAIIPGVLAVLTLIIFVKEPVTAGSNGNNFRFSLKGFSPNFKTYLLILILFTLGNSSDAFLLFRIEESISKSGAVVSIVNSIGPLREMVAGFGNTNDQETIINILFLPLVWSFFHVIKVIFSTPLGALSDRIGRKRAINAGWAVYAFVYFSFALLVFLPPDVQVLATFILFAIYALYYAFTEGAEKALVADMVNEDQRGSAYGMYNFAIGLGALPASVIFGLIYSLADRKLPGFGGTFAFGFGGLLALISMILLSIKVREPRHEID
jgi:Na+/melibiose symporter-like transporter